MFIIKYKKIFFAIAILLVGGSFAAMIFKGFNVGIDFKGGSVLEVSYAVRPDIEKIKTQVLAVQSEAQVQEIGPTDLIVRTAPIDEIQKEKILKALSFETFSATEKRFNTIGPSVGKELRSKALLSGILASLAIILFIAFAFRKITRPVSAWVYGLIAVFVLVHDVIIPAGFFALVGLQIDTLFVVGILTILGVSVNDTIVVFDRIRENLHFNQVKNKKEDFADTVGKSINQTLVRSVMTSVTVLIALGALYLFGPEATRNLSIAMFLGMFFGTYSSVFLASPLLVVWNDYVNK